MEPSTKPLYHLLFAHSGSAKQLLFKLTRPGSSRRGNHNGATTEIDQSIRINLAAWQPSTGSRLKPSRSSWKLLLANLAHFQSNFLSHFCHHCLTSPKPTQTRPNTLYAKSRFEAELDVAASFYIHLHASALSSLTNFYLVWLKLKLKLKLKSEQKLKLKPKWSLEQLE